MSILPMAVYEFNTIQVKLQSIFWGEFGSYLMMLRANTHGSVLMDHSW